MIDHQYRFVLFALTGLGNVVLERLIEAGHAPDLIVTRAERMPYPYDAIPFIGEVASRASVACLIDTDGENEVARRGAELLLIATYHRRVVAGLACKCRVAINLHPSILPRNRGPNPFFWSIRNGDSDTGVTAHLLAEELDAGDVCLQRRIPIGAEETQSTLRRKLGHLAADMAVKIVRTHAENGLRFDPQSEKDATSFPPVDDRQRQLDLTKSCAAVTRHINALREWPFALFDDRRVLHVLRVMPPTAGANPAAVLATGGAICRVRVADADLDLQLD
jgi:methionyl-tRNA formyltransferase